MVDLTGQRITQVTSGGPLSIHSDANWLIVMEAGFDEETGDGTWHELVGFECFRDRMMTRVVVVR